MKIRLKRAYDAVSPEDGERYLVDRLWPRGRSRDSLKLTAWLREVAPSTSLRRWFGHDPERWEEFRRRYLEELAERGEELQRLREAAWRGPITLVYGARDPEHNQAQVLREWLMGQGRDAG